MTLDIGVHALPRGSLAAVVTTLEMTAPHYDAVLPFPKGVTASREKLSLADYRALFRAVGQSWLWISRLTYDDDKLAGIIHDPAVETHVIRRDGTAIGLVELDFRQDAVSLSFFGLVPDATGSGIGKAMMALAQTRAFADGAPKLWLTTCTLDAPWALPFYHGQGFTTVKREIEVLADPRLSAIFPPSAGAMHTVLP